MMEPDDLTAKDLEVGDLILSPYGGLAMCVFRVQVMTGGMILVQSAIVWDCTMGRITSEGSDVIFDQTLWPSDQVIVVDDLPHKNDFRDRVKSGGIGRDRNGVLKIVQVITFEIGLSHWHDVIRKGAALINTQTADLVSSAVPVLDPEPDTLPAEAINDKPIDGAKALDIIKGMF